MMIRDTEEGEVAERKPRGEDAADGHRDEVFDDAVAGVPLNEDDLDADVTDDTDLDVEDEAATGRGGRRSTATKARPDTATSPKTTRPAKSTRAKNADRRSIFARFANFVREVVAELRKVNWPTRKELLTYTGVVVVFVAIVLTVVGLLDFGFAKGVLWVFGSGSKAK